MIRILHGDCRSVLRTLPAESVHCVVTSPPYFGLRDYGTAKWEGGDAGCDHWESKPNRREHARVTSGLEGGKESVHRSYIFGAQCGRCGARRIDSQIGLEPTPEAYVAELVAVVREVRRVLRKDGTCWLVIGDSYNSSAAGNKTPSGISQKTNKRMSVDLAAYNTQRSGLIAGLKPKDLIGIPWSVAFALRADGWWLRQEIIWAKPNPMPESVTDRCTKSHEQIFLLTKSATYYYDAAAIAEPATYAGDIKTVLGTSKDFDPDRQRTLLRGERTVAETRNKRSVWTVATAPFPGSHFAVFPPALIEPCILAGCPAKCCAKCGAPWVRETERVDQGYNGSRYGERAVGASGGAITGGTAKSTLGSSNGKLTGIRETIGFSPSCSCNAGTVAGTVLDPFGGAGTTGLVADRLQRNAILIELNAEYAAMAERRCFDDAPLFAEAAE